MDCGSACSVVPAQSLGGFQNQNQAKPGSVTKDQLTFGHQGLLMSHLVGEDGFNSLLLLAKQLNLGHAKLGSYLDMTHESLDASYYNDSPVELKCR